ncbi:hypothetical protein [Actinomadura macrotermitis]|uniref:Uncharacterized protein n=1 Tax=Actinomadura macrotermitis TaxID=2585200 RepID=A0A7K0C2T1_9ACTN|nr:hypothetical protein [Actinomadura macrotermitis]MQY07745.1 hypothetical protein [Actinomadura macrotermitis]
MMNETHSVLITARDIYDKLVELSGKVDGSLAAHEQLRLQVIDHEQRIRAVERWRYTLPASLLLGVMSAVASILAGFNAT